MLVMVQIQITVLNAIQTITSCKLVIHVVQIARQILRGWIKKIGFVNISVQLICIQ